MRVHLHVHLYDLLGTLLFIVPPDDLGRKSKQGTHRVALIHALVQSEMIFPAFVRLSHL